MRRAGGRLADITRLSGRSDTASRTQSDDRPACSANPEECLTPEGTPRRLHERHVLGEQPSCLAGYDGFRALSLNADHAEFGHEFVAPGRIHRLPAGA